VKFLPKCNILGEETGGTQYISRRIAEEAYGGEGRSQSGHTTGSDCP